jgi:NADPH-dependent curcumin reductase CurA
MPSMKRWVLAARNSGQGLPTEEDFEIQEDHTPDLAPGEILVRALFFSVDPILRLYMDYGMEAGDTIPGRQVARVVESRNKSFTKGKVV